jgi:hypothetical protein
MQATHRIVFDDGYLRKTQRLAIAQDWALKFVVYPTYWRWWPIRAALLVGVLFTYKGAEWVGLASFSLLFVASFLGPLFLQHALSKARRNRFTDSVATFSLTGDGIDTVGLDGTTHVQWSAVVKASIHPEGVLLKFTERNYVWLPDQSLTDGSPAAARQLVDAHVKDCKPAQP